MIWKCAAFEHLRKEVRDAYTEQFLKEQPNCLRLCGIIPDESELDTFFAKLAEYDGGEQQPPDAMTADEEDLNTTATISSRWQATAHAQQDKTMSGREEQDADYGTAKSTTTIRHGRLKAAPKGHKEQK